MPPLWILIGVLLGVLIYYVFRRLRIKQASASLERRLEMFDSMDMISLRIENDLDTDRMPRYFAYKKEYLMDTLNQHKCGSCYIISVCNMLSNRMSVATRGNLKELLSPQYLLCEDSGNTGEACGGGSPEDVLEYIEKNGVILDKFMPYQQNDFQDSVNRSACVLKDREALRPENKVYVEPGTVKFLCKSFFNIGSSTHLENIRRMKEEILRNGVIVGTVYVHDDLYNYVPGTVYKKSKYAKFLWGHSIIITGFCDKECSSLPASDKQIDLSKDENEMELEPHWRIHNTWSPSFGMQGYFWIRMYTNECEIESRASAAVPCLSKSLFSKLYHNLPPLGGAAPPYEIIY